MRVRKLLLPLALASCLLLGSGCASARTEAAGEARLLDTGDLGKSTTYRLREMAPDDLAHTASLSVSENWQLVKSIRTGSELRLKEICVSRGQSVEAGDPIAVLEGLGSQADVELLELEISSAEAGQKEMLAYYESALQAARDLRSGSEAERALRIEYAELELEGCRLQAKQYLSSLYSRLQALQAAADDVVLTSPVKGSVHILNTRLNPGDILPAGTEICSVYGDEGQRFYGSSSNGAFVYGREVSILLSKGSKSQTVSGRVVSSPEVNPGGYPGNVILIELQDPGELLGTGGEAKVSYTLLTEVFTVPSGALKTRDGVSYVELLEGDAVRTRNVVRGPAAGGYVAVLQGLQAGDQVIVSSYNS